ncbi:TetR-like C-terminal domain-containing protein [Thalassobacillus sp. C254]|uniref:TetR-like C-terminal domain-containing protein n=1 Tax=Thalassobacillus sp. C254 TaxID=1225341 RepID=UPI0006CF563E|nr:TetR-like C-terminal domain-containing protein [Thalassobacillus sp. C254]
MKKIAKELDTLDVGDWDKTTAPPSAAVKYFAFLKENAMFLKAILGPKGDPAFPSKMKYLIANQIKSRFAHVEQNVTQFPPDYLVAYLVSAHLGVVQHWIETGHKESPQEMAHIISSMNFYGPLAVGRWK